jgi:hypothetical protein
MFACTCDMSHTSKSSASTLLSIELLHNKLKLPVIDRDGT